MGAGVCRREAVFACTADGTAVECPVTAGAPAAETCNGLNDDCDQNVDEGLQRSCGTTDEGPCTWGMETCSAGQWTGCNAVLPQSDTSCDGVDQDCDGYVDNGAARTCWPPITITFSGTAQFTIARTSCYGNFESAMLTGPAPATSPASATIRCPLGATFTLSCDTRGEANKYVMTTLDPDLQGGQWTILDGKYETYTREVPAGGVTATCSAYTF